jgi:hypothetical protein
MTEAMSGSPQLAELSMGVRGRYGYWIVLALIMVAYGLCAAQDSPNPGPFVFFAQLATVAVALWIAEVPPSLLRVSWAGLAVAGAAAIAVVIIGTGGLVLDVFLSGASIVACLIAPAAIISHQVKVRGLGLQDLLAAICAYVLIGMMFTFVYNFMGLVTQTPIFEDGGADSLTRQLFFSFTTLTTTGFGNIVPVSPVVETVTVIEAIVGPLFLVMVVANIVTARAALRSN